MDFVIPFLFALHLLLALIYILGYLRLTSGFKKLDVTRQPRESNPPVSIIICLHNEEANIPGLIDHLKLQQYPRESLEIIFVDDRSTDNTYPLLAGHTIQNARVNIIRIDQTADGFAPKKYAITQAVEQAHGEILVFTDADGRPGANWISTMIAKFGPATGMVLGYAPYTTRAPYDKFIHKILALEYMSHAAISAATTGLNYPVTCVGTNLAYRKEVFTGLSGFGQYRNVHTGDDDLFLQRVREETSWQIRYVTESDSHVFNAPPKKFFDFYHQRIRYASKGFLYPLKFRLALILFYFFNVLFVINFFILFTHTIWLAAFLIALGIKFFADGSLMRYAARVLNDQRNLSLIAVTMILHIPYVLYFGLMARLQDFSWAGQRG